MTPNTLVKQMIARRVMTALEMEHLRWSLANNTQEAFSFDRFLEYCGGVITKTTCAGWRTGVLPTILEVRYIMAFTGESFEAITGDVPMPKKRGKENT